MKTTFTIKLPAWTTPSLVISDQLPGGGKYVLPYADVKYMRWNGGRMLRQFAEGHHFNMAFTEWELEKMLRFEVELNTPVLLLYYGFKGYLHCLHQQSRNRVSLQPGLYGMINVPAGTYAVTVNKGKTVTFFYQIDPVLLDWLTVWQKGFSLPFDYSDENREYYKFPFCTMDYNIGSMIRKLRLPAEDRQIPSAALSAKLFSLLNQYQKQLEGLKNKRAETTIEKVENIKSWIEQQVSENPLPSIVEITRIFGVGHRTLRRSFRKHTGMALHEFIHHARMKEGLRQLQKDTVTQVSQNLGYTSVAAFSKSFTMYHGFTPESVKKG